MVPSGCIPTTSDYMAVAIDARSWTAVILSNLIHDKYNEIILPNTGTLDTDLTFT